MTTIMIMDIIMVVLKKPQQYSLFKLSPKETMKITKTIGQMTKKKLKKVYSSSRQN